jgi:hypothetical protein
MKRSVLLVVLIAALSTVFSLTGFSTAEALGPYCEDLQGQQCFPPLPAPIRCTWRDGGEWGEPQAGGCVCYPSTGWGCFVL